MIIDGRSVLSMYRLGSDGKGNANEDDLEDLLLRPSGSRWSTGST